MIDTILSDSFPKEVTKAKVKEIFEILHTQERPDLIKEIKNLLQLKTNGKDGLKTSKVSKIIIWKFNILEFKRGVKLGSQRTESQQNFLNVPLKIYFHTHVSQSKFLKAYENAPKCPKFAADDLFPRACISK